MENFNQIDFGKLEPNSLYAVKFPDARYDHFNTWNASVVSGMMQKLNEIGQEYNIKFVPLFYGMEIVNGEEID